jgi:diguanylate cyclase (GGDEF)-like protein
MAIERVMQMSGKQKRRVAPKSKGNILIKADDPESLRLLAGFLRGDGYNVMAAGDGEIALDPVPARLPDLILLDIVSKETDGFAVCRRMQEDPSAAPVPVIFIGPMDDTVNRLKAFESGCVDYITRPFAEEELLARVRTRLKLANANRELLESNMELTREINARRSAEEASLESSFRLLQILQMISVPTFVIDMNHSITHWNSAIESLTDVPALEMIGTRYQCRAFYHSERPTLADLIVDGGGEEAIAGLYGNNFRRSHLIDGAYEVEGFFPTFGISGRWFYITAAPFADSFGRIIGAIETVQDITERKEAEKELKESEQRFREMSITDSLTKLHNSRHFFRQLDYEVNRARRYNTSLSLMLMDIDNFKRYNDTYGHLEGDIVLKVLSATIKGNLRDSDTAYRYGGEEFTVILPETEGEDAFHAAERLRTDFEGRVLSPPSETEAHMTVSIGVGRYCPGESADAFLKRVDEAMYLAKKDGKNRVFCATDPEETIDILPSLIAKRVTPVYPRG